MDNNKDFEKLIKKDRDLHQARSWRGNLLGYLDEVKADPSIAKLAHARLYDVIMKVGVRDIQDSGDPHVRRLYKDESIKVYDFFADEFFGIERPSPRSCATFTPPLSKGKRAARSCISWGRLVRGKALWLRSFTAAWKTASPFTPSRVPDVRGSTPPDPAPSEKGI